MTGSNPSIPVIWLDQMIHQPDLFLRFKWATGVSECVYPVQPDEKESFSDTPSSLDSQPSPSTHTLVPPPASHDEDTHAAKVVTKKNASTSSSKGNQHVHDSLSGPEHHAIFRGLHKNLPKWHPTNQKRILRYLRKIVPDPCLPVLLANHFKNSEGVEENSPQPHSGVQQMYLEIRDLGLIAGSVDIIINKKTKRGTHAVEDSANAGMAMFDGSCAVLDFDADIANISEIHFRRIFLKCVLVNFIRERPVTVYCTDFTSTAIKANIVKGLRGIPMVLFEYISIPMLVTEIQNCHKQKKTIASKALCDTIFRYKYGWALPEERSQMLIELDERHDGGLSERILQPSTSPNRLNRLNIRRGSVAFANDTNNTESNQVSGPVPSPKRLKAESNASYSSGKATSGNSRGFTTHSAVAESRMRNITAALIGQTNSTVTDKATESRNLESSSTSATGISSRIQINEADRKKKALYEVQTTSSSVRRTPTTFSTSTNGLAMEIPVNPNPTVPAVDSTVRNQKKDLSKPTAETSSATDDLYPSADEEEYQSGSDESRSGAEDSE